MPQLGSCATVSVVFLSILLLVPLDPSVIVGDFTPAEYVGKTNPLADDSILVQDFYFESGKDKKKCHAWLYSKKQLKVDTENVNENNEPSALPVIVMAGGLGTQKDFGLDRYASRFVQQGGMAVFLLDYRNFGASEGVPRNWISPRRHLEDYRAALDFLYRTQGLGGRVDTTKIGLWGTSFSGGHVLQLLGSTDPLSTEAMRGVQAIVSQVPHLSGKEAAKKGLKTRGLMKMARMALAALQDLARSCVGMSPVSTRIIDGSGKELAIMAVTQDEHDKYTAKHPPLGKILGGWINQTPARVLVEIRFYNPIDTLQQKYVSGKPQQQQSVTNPHVLLIGARHDDLCPPGLIEQAHEILPNSQLIMRDGSHFDIYEPWNSDPMGDAMVKFYLSSFFGS